MKLNRPSGKNSISKKMLQEVIKYDDFSDERTIVQIYVYTTNHVSHCIDRTICERLEK